MALNIGEVMVRLMANTSDFTRGMNTAKTSMGGLTGFMQSSGLAASLSIGAVAAGAVALGTAAVKSSMTFNKAMANIGTMIPGNQKRLQELKKDIMDLSSEWGMSADTIAEGVYQSISAFGDSADTMNKVRLATKFAVAGVTDVRTAMSLLATVTRAYGDTSQKALERAADLAFIAAKGITTPEELARAVPNAVPAAVALGIKQEELFAAFGTLSGITGTAAEVSTQLEAVFRALLVPPEELKPVMALLADNLIRQDKLSGPLVDTYKSMTKQMDLLREQYSRASEKDAPKFLKRLEDMKKQSLDAAGGLGPVIVNAVGLSGTMGELSKSVGGNTSQLGRMLGRMEGMNAALQLGGPQAGNYQQALDDMKTKGVSPLTTALAEQTDGINKAGHEWEKFKTRASNAMIRLGDNIGTVMLGIMDGPAKIATSWNEGWEEVKKGLPGPDFVDPFAHGMDRLRRETEETSGYVTKTWGERWREFTQQVPGPEFVDPFAHGTERLRRESETTSSAVNTSFSTMYTGIRDSAANGWESARSGFSQFWTSVTNFFANTWAYSVAGMGSLWDGIRTSAAGGWDSVKSGFSSLWTSVTDWFAGLWKARVAAMGSLWDGIRNSAAGGWESVRSSFSGLWTSITTFFQNTWTYIANILNGEDGLWAKVRNSATNAWSVVWSGFNTLWTNISNWFSQLASAGYAWGVNLFQKFWEGMKSWLGGSSGSGSVNPALPFQGFATGGIVTSPTLAMVGEAGPEAIIPLNRMGGGGNYITINVNGSGSPDSVADAIVQRLKLKGIRVV